MLLGDWDGQPSLRVIVVGDISRTWHEDKLLLFDTLLDHGDPGMYLVLHGGHGFDHMAKQVGYDLEIRVELHSVECEVPREGRFSHQGISLDVHSVLVLTRRGQSEDVMEVDPPVVEWAVQNGKTVISLDEEGNLQSWP